MRRLLVIASLLWAAACAGPAERVPVADGGGVARPSVWEVRSPDGVLRFHLLGSVHLGSERMLDLGPAVEAAFASAKELVLEADLTTIDPAEIAAQTQRYGVIPPPALLPDRISPETYALLQAYCEERGIPLATFLRAEPWLATLTFALIEYQRLGLDPELGVDRVFQQRAQEKGLPVVGLETLELQLRMLAELPAEFQELMLHDALESRAEFEAEARAMLDAWADGDEVALGEIVLADQGDPAFAAFYERVIFERNRRMVDVLVGLPVATSPRLVIVGAAHMIGSEGLPALLAGRGFRVEEIQ